MNDIGNKIKNNIISMVEKVFDKKIKETNYCKTVYGQIQQYNKDNSYDVLINGQVQTIYAMNDDKYLIGNTVIIIILDNTNYSNKMILCKKPANII